MATYGRGQMLGAGINPESFKQDYSGFTRAAEIQAQGLSNLGASIGGAIKIVGDEKKQINQDIAKGKSALQFAKANYPELAGRIDEIGKIFSDVNVSKADQAAAGSQMGDFVTAMIRGQEFNTEVELKKRSLDIEEALNIQSEKTRQAEIKAAANKPGSLENIAVPGGIQQMVRNPITGVFEPIKITEQSPSSLSNLPDALKPFSKDFETAGAKYGVDPKLLAAIAMHETGNGTSSAFRNKNNAMGVSDASGPIQMNSVSDSIERMSMLLGKGINEGTGPYANAKSIEDIANIYAPPGAGNDPRNLNQFWTQGVTSNIQKLSGNKTEQVEPTSQNQGRVGFTPGKAIQNPVTISEEKLIDFLTKGIKPEGQLNPDGTFNVTGFAAGSLPTGMTVESDGQGGLKIVQGPGVGAKAERSENSKIDKAMSLTQDLNLLEDRTQSMAPGVAGAVARVTAEQIPGTPQAGNKEIIDRVVATLTLENLQAMRNNSPTGAALGNVSDKDTGLMRDSATSLKNAQTPESFKRELVRLKNLQHDVIYGSKRVLEQKLKKQEITKAQFDEAMANAPIEYIDERGAIKTRKVNTSIVPSSGAESIYSKYLDTPPTE